MDNPVPIKPYSLTELAAMYGISTTTMKKWIDLIQDLPQGMGKIYTVNQVHKIFERIGRPTTD